MRTTLLAVLLAVPALASAAEAPSQAFHVPTSLRLVPPAPLLALAPPDAGTLLLAGDPTIAPAGADFASDPGLAAQRAKLLGVHRVLRMATAASLVGTAALGGLVTLNKPTIFGDGRCASGDPIFGEYGCDSLSTVHGISAVLSATLYTATGVLGLATPGGSAFGHRDAGWYEALGYVHLAGIVVQPLLGLIARYPQIIGAEHVTNLGRDLRSAHVLIGDVTVLAYLLTVFLAEPE